MKLLISLLLFLATFVVGQAQTPRVVNGYVEDEATGERLIGVNIYVSGTSFGTSTNSFGFYSLTIPNKSLVITASYIGYASKNDTLDLSTGNQTHNFKLSVSTSQLNEVEISTEESAVQQTQMSTITLGIPEIEKMPAFMGEVDIIRAIQLLPGVQSGTEGTTGFYVRGGSPDQNLILLDGVPVYNASHLFGFFSVFNSDAIKNVQLTKGGFPARYGGRLSSVLDISMKEGNMKEFHGAGSVGLISSRLTLEGPLFKNKTSFMLSGRRTYHDLLIRPFLQKGVKLGYYFGDFNAKINHIISQKDRLYLSFYSGADKFYNGSKIYYGNKIEEDEQYLKWGNRTGALRWNHLFGDKLFANLSATYTHYQYNVGYEFKGEPDFYKYEYTSKIEDYGAKMDFEYSLNSKHHIKFGANYVYHTFTPGGIQLVSESDWQDVDSLLQLSSIINANDVSAYVEDNWRITQRWKANYGLHYSTYFVNGTTYQSLQPRFSTAYLINENWALKASYANMNQYIHLLSNSGIGLPTDLWVSSTNNVKPQQSNQIAMGSTHNLFENRFEFTAEVYYKWMDHLIAYKPGATFISNSDWQDNVETGGNGEAYGLELLLRKQKGKTTGWIGYTLAWSNRQFENLNEGNPFPFKYDRRHDLSIVLNHQLTKRIDVGATWVYSTGNAFTGPQSYYTVGQDGNTPVDVLRYTDRNELRIPSYHRLDLSINFRKKKKWGERIWNISVYNAYSRRNPMFIYAKDRYGRKPSFQQVSLFPIIPSFSYIFKF